MKSTIITLMQKVGLRLPFCVLVMGLCVPAMAQSDDEEEIDESELSIKQPKRQQTVSNYPLLTVKGRVTDLATGKPLAGVQLRALGHDRYTAMTEENGTFEVKVPDFITSLYVFSPEYLPLQVGIKAGDSTQVISVKMLSDKYRSMYGKGTTYTAQGEANIVKSAITVENEIANVLGGDVHAIQRSGNQEGGLSMFIRGLNSLTSNAQPLIVIDGVEQEMQRNRISLHDGQFNNILANISPDDIEKVTVLKNATALYGSRGANGVILIETKRGHSMATRIDANISASYSLIPQLPTLMNAQQYRLYATEMLGTQGLLNQQELVLERKRQQYISNPTITLDFLNDDPNGYYYYTYHNDTDWTKSVYRKALTQNYGINVQGGDDIGMYHLSVGYMTSDKNIKNSDFERMNIRFNTDINILWNLSTKFDLSISRTNSSVFDDGIPADLSAGVISSPTFLSQIKSPLLSPYQYNKMAGGYTSLLSEADAMYKSLNLGSTVDNYSLANPAALLYYGEGENKNKAENTYFNIHLEPTLLLGKNFRLTELINYTLIRSAQRYYRPYKGMPRFEVSGVGVVSSEVGSMFPKQTNFQSNTRLDWDRQMGRHSLAAFAGFRYNYFSYDGGRLTSTYSGETNDKNPSLSDGAPYPSVSGTNEVWKTLQWYGNVDYNYMNRYFATVSLMAEANSRFGENADGLKLFGTQWAIFPSIQLGWVLTNESWFPKHAGINYLRLNAGYDVSGNDDISNYAARTSFSVVKYNYRATGIQMTNVGNDKIQWETTKKLNLGFQLNAVNNRLSLNYNYFYHKTDNLLTLQSFSNPVGGINQYWSNGGSLTNEGFEVALSGKPIVARNWHLEVGASIGHYVNKVTKLPGNDQVSLGGGTTAQGYVSSVYGADNVATLVGQPVAQFYGYVTEGVFKDDAEAKKAGNNDYLYMVDNTQTKHAFQSGDVHFKDLNGDGIIDDSDKTIIGNPNPDCYGNIFATLNYKRLTLNVGLNYSIGNDVYNYQRSVLNSGSTLYNQQVAEVGHWRYEGQEAKLPRLNYGDPMGNNRFSDRWIEDGSYLRLKTVNLNYQIPIPESWTSWLQGMSVWVEAQNLLTLTKYTGCDPEFSIGNSVMYQGIDCGNIPQSRSFSAGIKINL